MYVSSEKNPLLRDIPGTVTIGGSTRLFIKEVVWQNPGNAKTLTLTINGSTVIRKSTAANTDYSIFELPIGWVDPFTIVSMTGGVLEIWLDT